MSSSGERLSSLSLETYAAFALADELSSLVIVGAAVVAAAPCGEESQSRKASTELSDGERGIVGCGVGESGSDAMNWVKSVWREEERWNRLEWLLMLSFIQCQFKKEIQNEIKIEIKIEMKCNRKLGNKIHVQRWTEPQATCHDATLFI